MPCILSFLPHNDSLKRVIIPEEAEAREAHQFAFGLSRMFPSLGSAGLNIEAVFLFPMSMSYDLL